MLEALFHQVNIILKLFLHYVENLTGNNYVRDYELKTYKEEFRTKFMFCFQIGDFYNYYVNSNTIREKVKVKRVMYKILMIEDNAGDVTLIKEAINIYEFDADVNVAKNGEEALSYLNEKVNESNSASLPDLIILDLNIPRLDGRYVLSAIRKLDMLIKVPILIFTSSSYDIDEKVCSELGADLFLTKPIEFEQYSGIIKSLKELIERSKNKH